MIYSWLASNKIDLTSLKFILNKSICLYAYKITVIFQILQFQLKLKANEQEMAMKFIGFNNPKYLGINIGLFILALTITQVVSDNTCNKIYKIYVDSNDFQSEEGLCAEEKVQQFTFRSEYGISGIREDMRAFFRTGFGHRESNQTIKFSKKFKNPPHVQLGYIGLDSTYNLRIVTTAQNISNQGFNLLIRTWHDTKIWRCDLSWLALGV